MACCCPAPACVTWKARAGSHHSPGSKHHTLTLELSRDCDFDIHDGLQDVRLGVLVGLPATECSKAKQSTKGEAAWPAFESTDPR
eukprot:1158230-Pelagomonas_calceolata.AAC.2